mmetsp:Transcript_3952/g.7703  ORF Transcript_3952/g.7703 Transcript_3952/m.7703 type:complete len:531 (+) Transcript_3952:219-1811(+)
MVDLGKPSSAVGKPAATQLGIVGTFMAFKPFTLQCLLTMGSLKFVAGYTMGAMAGIMLFAPNELGLNEVNVETVLGSSNFAAAFSAVSLGWIAKSFGSRVGATVAIVIQVVGLATIAAAWDYESMLVGRALGGVGLGLSMVTVNSYLVDLAPAKHRGAAGCIAEAAVQTGITTGYLFALVFYGFPDAYCWRLMAALIILPALLLLFQIQQLPESPRWLITNHQAHEARTVLEMTCDPEDVDATFDRLQKAVNKDQLLSDVSFIEVLCQSRPVARKALVIAMIITVGQQLSGADIIVSYVPQIMGTAGVRGRLMQLVASLAVGVWRTASTFWGMSLVDSGALGGRRSIMLVSVAGASASMFLLAVAIFLPNSSLAGLLAVGAVMGFVTMFEVGMGPTSWVLASETLPSRERSSGLAICGFSSRMTAGMMVSTYLSLSTLMSEGGVFCFYASLTALNCLLAYCLYPETKGKTLEEIEQQLMPEDAEPEEHKSRIWRTKSKEVRNLTGYGTTSNTTLASHFAPELSPIEEQKV